jgi:hypothetical protein
MAAARTRSRQSRAVGVRTSLVAVALAAAATTVGCGDQEESPARAKPVGKPSAGSVVQFADCGDWRRGTSAERVATIEELRGQLTPQTSRTAASPLPDQRAYEILDRACRFETAESLRLYKLYVRAQGFAPLGE